MHGVQLTFFTQQDRRQDGSSLADWLLNLAKESGLHGGTIMAAAKGFGHSGHLHSASFFDLADQPQMVLMTATAEQARALLARLGSEKINVSYIQSAVEFGVVGVETR